MQKAILLGFPGTPAWHVIVNLSADVDATAVLQRVQCFPQQIDLGLLREKVDGKEIRRTQHLSIAAPEGVKITAVPTAHLMAERLAGSPRRTEMRARGTGSGHIFHFDITETLHDSTTYESTVQFKTSDS